MAEMVICLLVAIATTLGAAGRAAGLLSILPRTVVNILGVVVDILEVVTDILGAVTDILGAGGAQPFVHPAATASHTALTLVTAIAVVTEGEFVLFLRDKHRVVFGLAVHTGKRLFHIVARVAVVWALPATAVVEEETQRISVVVPALAVGGIDAGGIGPSIALEIRIKLWQTHFFSLLVMARQKSVPFCTHYSFFIFTFVTH